MKRNKEKRKEISLDRKKGLLRKMIDARSRILAQYPFYGYLVMQLQLGLSDCGTACTDMKHLLFDPEFAEQLSEEEMVFVMLHEVLHCSLSHCTRGRGYHQEIYNIAADIVVNSDILYDMGIPEFSVGGLPVMHRTPDGREGRDFSVEEIYDMIMQTSSIVSQCGFPGTPDSVRIPSGDGPDEPKGPDYDSDFTESGDPADDELTDRGPAEGSFDSHEIWSSVEENSSLADRWKKIIKEGVKKYSREQIPVSAREYVMALEWEEKADWRALLQDFIQIYHDRYDYSFSPADRRYTWSDFVMPAFAEQEEERIDNLWFCVDTSGSISQQELSEAMSEIRQALLLFEHLSGKISFFDTRITDPVPFEDEEDIMNLPASGGGGTDFSLIFQYLAEFPEDNMPTAIIILTDGECDYPEKSAAMDIPVLWIIYDNPKDPPWGRVAHIESDPV